MTIVVAGATGLAGSAITKVFQDAGHEVFGINREVVDLLDLTQTSQVLKELRPTLVIDAAARVGGIGANNDFPVEFLEDNIRIQVNLMHAAHSAMVKNFIFLGSSCIYPKDSQQPIKEEYLMTGPLEPTNSAYAIAKIAGIELINSYRRQHGHNWISLMPTNLYGPRDNFDLNTSHVLPALIRRFVEAVDNGVSTVTLWGTGSPKREFLYVDDLAGAVLVASEKYNSDLHLNIGTGKELSIKELAQKIATLTGFNGTILWDSSKPDGTKRKLLDISRIKQLGWSPHVTLDEGLAFTISWYKSALVKGESRR